MKPTPQKWPEGWLIFDGFAAEPQPVYASRAECQRAIDDMQAAAAAWDRAGLADAPHFDAY